LETILYACGRRRDRTAMRVPSETLAVLTLSMPCIYGDRIE
jgi:hypothetical protein